MMSGLFKDCRLRCRRIMFSRLFAVAIIFSLTAINFDAAASPDSAVTLNSPNHRYAVRFSDPRSDSDDAGRLWGKISVCDLKTGAERTARVASGQRKQGNFEGFSVYDERAAWSPDSLYLAFWVDSCQNEPAVSAGVVCHLHEVHFLSMRENHCDKEWPLRLRRLAAYKTPHRS